MRGLIFFLPLLLTLPRAGGVGDQLLTPGHMEQIVEAHNAARRRVSATNMRLMEWDDELASLSLQLSEECVWTRAPRDSLRDVVRGFQQLAQNIHVEGVRSDVSSVVERWEEEGHHYRYDTGQCNKVCWGYTQVVWANTHAVGCSLRYCPTIENVMWGDHGGYLFSCLYGPGGNTEERPYIQGSTPCSACDVSFPYCVYGLCSRRNFTTTSTTTTPAPVPSTTSLPEQTTVSTGSASNLLPLGVVYLLALVLTVRGDL